MERFDGATVIVSGSTRGIGLAIARRFAREGAAVVLCGRSREAGRRAAARIRAAGGEARFIRTDVREPSDIVTLVDATVEHYGGIDVVVNNAAVQTETSVVDATLEDWERVVETDFRAYWLLVREAVEHMDSGCIINVSSNHAFSTMPALFPYNAVKAGINGMTRAMALDLSPEIRVNTINPGWIAVDRTLEGLDDDQRRHLDEIHPVDRIGRPEDVAGVATFLASEDAAFVTGASLLVDGGRGAVMQDDRL